MMPGTGGLVKAVETASGVSAVRLRRGHGGRAETGKPPHGAWQPALTAGAGRMAPWPRHGSHTHTRATHGPGSNQASPVTTRRPLDHTTHLTTPAPGLFVAFSTHPARR